jgi:hypothetical protein
MGVAGQILALIEEFSGKIQNSFKTRRRQLASMQCTNYSFGLAPQGINPNIALAAGAKAMIERNIPGIEPDSEEHLHSRRTFQVIPVIPRWRLI